MLEIIKSGLETSIQDFPGRELAIGIKDFHPQVQWIIGLFGSLIF